MIDNCVNYLFHKNELSDEASYRVLSKGNLDPIEKITKVKIAIIFLIVLLYVENYEFAVI